MAQYKNDNAYPVRLSGKTVYNIEPRGVASINEDFASLPRGVYVVKSNKVAKVKAAPVKVENTVAEQSDSQLWGLDPLDHRPDMGTPLGP